MGRTKTFKEFLNRGEQRTRPEEQRIVNNKQARRLIASGTRRKYDRGVGVWREYQKLKPGAKLDNYETPKAFILMIAKAIDGRYGDDDACLRTVRQYWKNTTAGLDREGEPVDPKIIESTTNSINDDLQKELKLPLFKRARKYAAMPHLVYLARLPWGYDWHRYGSPKDRLDLWDGILLNAFTSARVGEYIESTDREGSGRGLRYEVRRLLWCCSVVLTDADTITTCGSSSSATSRAIPSSRWR